MAATYTSERELGYRTAVAVADAWDAQRRIVLDDGAALGTRFVVAGPWMLYICTDAQAWGTLFRFDSAQTAQAYAAERLGEVQRMMDEIAAEAAEED